jgi:hypothetical protein
MERGRKQYRIAGILVLCALGACSGETVTGAPMAVPTSAGLTAVDTLALRMLSEQWGATTNGYRAALLRLHARHFDNDAVLASHQSGTVRRDGGKLAGLLYQESDNWQLCETRSDVLHRELGTGRIFETWRHDADDRRARAELLERDRSSNHA